MGVVEQAASAECLCKSGLVCREDCSCAYPGSSFGCTACVEGNYPNKHPTGLRWPALSRECRGVGDYVCDKGRLAAPGQTEGCPTCGGSGAQNAYNKDNLVSGSGRIPDVSLEKVLDLLLKDNHYRDVWEITIGAGYRYFIWKESEEDSTFEGDTLLEAACAALLAT